MKKSRTFRFSDESSQILDNLSNRTGLTQTGVLEFLLHMYRDERLNMNAHRTLNRLLSGVKPAPPAQTDK